MAANREPQVFLFLSDMLGKKIVDESGNVIGHVYDITAEFVEPYPFSHRFDHRFCPEKKAALPALEKCCRPR